MSALLFLIALLGVATNLPESKGSFSSVLVSKISKGNWNTNFVYSPLSLKIGLAMVYLGAEGDTASELRGALKLSTSKEAVIEEFLSKFKNSKNQDFTFHMANAFFLDKTLKLTDNFKSLAKSAHLDIKHLNHAESKKNVELINGWLSKGTEKKIGPLIIDDSKEDWSVRTTMINEVYFKAKWENPFSLKRRWKNNFDAKPMEMMVQENIMGFGVFNDFGAYATQLKLQGTDIYMLVLRPKRASDLAVLVEKLQNVELPHLMKNLYDAKITLMMPKFRVETDVGLKRVLQRLKLRNLFYNADFNGIAEKSQISFTEVRHKTVIEINESGIEVAAATGFEVYNPQSFESQVLNHNFFFALMDKNVVYFAGHVGRPD